MASSIASLQAFSLIGIATALYFLKRLYTFVWLYFLRPSSLYRFGYEKEPYAVITGASDGIGRATALELYQEGFNLILHGRNEAKLKKVIAEIRDTARGPTRDIKYFIASADRADVNFEKIVNEYKQLHVTLLINNVGGGSLRSRRIDAEDQEGLLSEIRTNALFSFCLTRAFLPQLRSAGGPAEVVFVGSQSADMPIPRLYSYAPSKAFLYQLTRCLNADERYWTPSPVRFVYWNVGTVVTNALRGEPTFFYPPAAKFAKHVVTKIGCGRERVTPYWPHAVQQFLGESLLPTPLLRHYAAETMKKIIDEYEKRVE